MRLSCTTTYLLVRAFLELFENSSPYNLLRAIAGLIRDIKGRRARTTVYGGTF
ncbi:7910_t:CDS:2 [Diversispora eburnea]|uniref:7910_t:CDS:1 n=1 Tax=Diversispora eburnea TaxID=1213867 RepID=A0A9N9ABL3_9GLOM|nr:7910_t:CDS:2 [Diversispora eburnea]